jgi:hypothetical protein
LIDASGRVSRYIVSMAGVEFSKGRNIRKFHDINMSGLNIVIERCYPFT